MSFLREAWKILWMCLRYLMACLFGTLGIMSLASGKFPPPIKDIYQTITSLQHAANISETTAKIAKARDEQRQIMDFLDSVDNGDVKRPVAKAVNPGTEGNSVDGNGQQAAREVANVNVETVSDKERIKALEYEVAYLKAKLARAEWETRQAQSRQAAAQSQ